MHFSITPSGLEFFQQNLTETGSTCESHKGPGRGSAVAGRALHGGAEAVEVGAGPRGPFGVTLPGSPM